MKKLFFLILSSFLFLFSFAAPKDQAVINNGTWAYSATWNLNRKPFTGDTVVIPAGQTVIINTNENNYYSLYIIVYGTLKLSNGKLGLAPTSTIIVYPTGSINSSGNAKIVIGSNEVYEDENGTIAGPVVASSFTDGFTPFSPLPVKFVGFTVTSKDNNALIQWSTSEEISANMYEVERSEDGTNWSTIAYVAAIGNSSVLNNYSFTDKNLAAKVVYYRIKEVDLDGKINLTAIKSIRTNSVYTTADIKIASVQNKVLLQFPKEVKGNLVVRFVSISGQVIDQQTISNPLGQVVLNSKVTGNYIIAVTNGQDINTAKQVIL